MVRIKSVHFDDYDTNWYNPEVYVKSHIFVFILQGKVQYALNGSRCELDKSDFLLIPTGTRREAWSHPGGGHQKYTVFFEPEESVQQSLPLLCSRSHRIERCHLFDYVKQRFAVLHQHWVGRQPYFEVLCASICTELLTLLYREISMRHLSPIKIRLCEQLKEYIIEHYRAPIRLEELARQIDRSANYTNAIFKETTGQTPIEFMLQLRISTARELLADTEMTQADIARYLGFFDASYFYRTFKRLTGSTPASVRQAARLSRS
ncbi:helix-turn-helix transcriptional regulator [Cohnella fermenti]|uniref:AraC family transcriptional regulator n=1 Tax=Cohnella fermenti TaxID=2565925 RepID=A0A4V3WFA7_9BACL|nr:AraC family transcriptional regulator [Cohnella fermenti]THF79096.1 AraC family transcriptional regulator [Cohnella fermenti]